MDQVKGSDSKTSTPSPLLSFGLRSRRNSVSSLTSNDRVTKDALALVLDQIHTSASKSSTLTTFNDFAPPPPSASSNEDRTPTSHLGQNGVSSIYERLRASVGAAKEPLSSDSQLSSSYAVDNTSRQKVKSDGSQTRSPVQLSVDSTSLTRDSTSIDASSAHDGTFSTPGRSAIGPSGTWSATRDDSRQESPYRHDKQAIQISERIGSATSPVLNPRKIDGSTKSLVLSPEYPMNQDPSIQLHPQNISEPDLRQRNQTQTEDAFRNVSALVGVLHENEAATQADVPLRSTSELAAILSSGSSYSKIGNRDRMRKSENTQRGSLSLQVQKPNAPSYDTESNSRLTSPQNEQITTSRPADYDLDKKRVPFLRINSSRPLSTSSVQSLAYERSSSTADSISISRPTTETGQKDFMETSSSLGSSDFVPSMTSYDSRRKNLISKDFWMKDDNAKVCFRCGDSFSTFRRKHHCRMCGQIYDGKCTSLISGKLFGQPGTVRVCKTCQTIVTAENDSSEDSDDGEFTASSINRQQKFSKPIPDLDIAHGSHRVSTPSQSHRFSMAVNQEIDPAGSPNSGLPSPRRLRDVKRRSLAIAAADTQPLLTRPSSSRSLKSLLGRPRSSSHKHIPLHHQPIRSFRTSQDIGAPFHRSASIEQMLTPTLPAFHTDSIVDPDLAPFLSDEDTSEDEPTSIDANLHEEPHVGGVPGVSGLLSAMRRNKSQLTGKSMNIGSASRLEADRLSISSSHVGKLRRQMRNRNLSSSSMAHYGSSPRIKRSENVFTNAGVVDETHKDTPGQIESLAVPMSNVFMQSDAGISAKQHQSSELNRASHRHIQNLLDQCLSDSNIEHIRRWSKVLMPIIVRCAQSLDPSMQRDDDIDVRQYIKLKKAPGGRPSDTAYFSGVVFTKNVALKTMPRNLENARLLLISFPIVYSRHRQHFMSLEPIIAQEREYLRKLVNRILTLQPQVLLVQNDVSGLALQFLQEANIAVVCQLKESVMRAISRCTRTRIISSVDKLAMDPGFLGYCANFDVKTLVSSGVRKSYIFVSGCPSDLGCTIVLRGANIDILTKLKPITEFMCYAAYHLKLETGLMRDEFVSMPPPEALQFPHRRQSSLLELARSPLLASPPKTVHDEGHEVDGYLLNTQGDVESHDTVSGRISSNTLPSQSQNTTEGLQRYTYLLTELKSRILSASPTVSFEDPFLLQKGKEEEGQLLRLRRLQQRLSLENNGPDDKSEKYDFQLIQPEMVYNVTQSGSRPVREVIGAIHDAEYERAFHRYNTFRRRWEIYLAGALDPFSPFSHQRIVVLFSIVSTNTVNACAGPDLLGLDFYQEQSFSSRLEPDVPLGEYVEALCGQAEMHCIAGRCDQAMLNHHRQYVHGDGQISIFIRKDAPKLRGLQDTILMWSTCKICGQDTQVTPMSSNSWKYSFGKYLELTFWSKPLYPRAGLCTHDIHRDHDRFFGFKGFLISVNYEPINLLEVIVPRATITWKVEKDLQLKNFQYRKIEERLNKFMSSVKDRLKSINIENIDLQKKSECKAEIDALTEKATADCDWLTSKLQEKYMGSRFYEIIPLNRAVRAMQEKVAEWDTAFTDFERNFLPSDKDMRMMVTQQLRKMYLNQDESAISVHPIEPQAGATVHEVLSSNEKIVDGDFEDSKDDLSFNSGAQLDSTSLELDQQSGSSEKATISDPSTQFGANLSTEERSAHGPTATAVDSPAPHLDLAIHTQTPLESGNLHLDPGDSRLLRSNVNQVVARPHNETYRITSTIPTEYKVTTVSEWQRPSMHATTSSKSALLTAAASTTHQTLTPSRSPSLIRSKTQPEGLPRKDLDKSSNPPVEAIVSLPGVIAGKVSHPVVSHHKSSSSVEKLSAKSRANSMKPTKSTRQSLIPRAISNKQFESKVSALAKHFEQLSREFERERLRERHRKFTRNRLRAFPTASSKPIVEVYRDAHEAVRERDSSDLHAKTASSPSPVNDLHGQGRTEAMISAAGYDPSPFSDVTDELEVSDSQQTGAGGGVDVDTSYPVSEIEDGTSDAEVQVAPGFDDGDEQQALNAAGSGLDLSVELPKHEKGTLMKMLTSFWSERSASGWSPLEYPLVPTDHIFADSDLVVREDEPSSMIAFALASLDYKVKMRKFHDRVNGPEKRPESQQARSTDNEDPEVERILLGETATHLRYQFQDSQATMHCKVFYSESFDAIRRKCGVAERFVESLSRCLKWDSKGGKTKSLFLKTLDERFVLKSLSQVEVQAFLKFAPDYFHYMSETLFHSLPSAIAKILGFYQVVIRNPVTGTAFNHFLQVMENVFYEGPSNRMFDLKGSMRNRKIESTGEENEVLLDENLLDYVSQSPIYIRNHANSVLAQSVQNDTLFCSKQNVMDYSLIVGLYEDKKELVVGVIDYIRTYTWDKKLESMIKDRGKHKATVREPRKYRARFRESIARYFPLAPSCWHIFPAQRVGSQPPMHVAHLPFGEEATLAVAEATEQDDSEQH